MFDHMIFGAVLASILVVILALLKLAIEYPGCFSWCMRSVHKRTEKHSGGENDDSDHEDSPDPEHPHLSRRGSKVVTRCRSQATMSRTATDPELVKRRLELDEIITFDETPPHDSHSRLAEIKKKSNYDRRYSHDHHHHKKHHRDHRDHYDRRHSSHDHHHRHHHQKKHLHHRHVHDHHHSSTSFEDDSPPGGKRRALSKIPRSEYPRPQEIVITDSSQERVSGDSPASSTSLEKIKSAHSKNNMRININNVNILIPRHLPKDVTINIDMDEEEETELVTAALDHPDQHHLHLETHHEAHHDPHEHHEVRSSDSGIGWDDHHSHEHQDQEHHQDQDHHDVNNTVDIEPIAEEDQERNVNVESDDSKNNFVAKLDCLPLKDPRRPRHNTFT